MTRPQHGISALVSQTSLREEISGDVAKCRLFSQATHDRVAFAKGAFHRPYSRIWMHRIIRNIRWLTCYAPESRMIGIKGNNDVIFLASRLVITKQQQQQPKRWTSTVTIEETTFERAKWGAPQKMPPLEQRKKIFSFFSNTRKARKLRHEFLTRRNP